MVKRMLAVGAVVAVALSPAVLLGSLYIHDRPVPYRSNYTLVCEHYAGLPCASLTTIFLAGTVLRVVGVTLCACAIVLGAALLLRLTARGRVALVSMIAATESGAYALWLSQQALRDYTSLSLLPDRFPAGFFERYVVHDEQLARIYVAWRLTLAFSVVWGLCTIPVFGLLLNSLPGLLPSDLINSLQVDHTFLQDGGAVVICIMSAALWGKSLVEPTLCKKRSCW